MLAGMQTNAWKLKPDDFVGFLKALEQIRDAGYDGFETDFRHIQPAFGKKAASAKSDIAATGLRFLGCHIALSNYDAKTNIPPMDQLESIADGAASLGAERLIVSGSAVADEGPIDPQRLSWKSGALNRAGRYTQPLKMRVCYHNHGHEFANDGAEIQALLREADPDLVRFIIDTADAFHAKADLAAFFIRNHKRIDGLHLSSSAADLPYEPLAIAIRKAKWTGWLIAEEEGHAETVKPAREQIRKLFGV